MSSSSGPNNPGGGGDAHQPPPPPPRSLASTAAAMAAAAGASYHGNQLVFVVNPLPSTEEQLNERILDSAERLRSQSTTNAAGSNNSQTAAPNPIPGPSTSTAAESVEQQQQQQMPRPSVLQCVISHGYVAVLLEDHRVCRFQYNIYPERIANAESSSKSSLSANNNSSSGGGSHRLSSLSSSGNNSLVAGGGSSSARTVQTARRRLIRHSARGPRGGPGGSASATAASVIMGHRGAVIPAQFVPEDLINQAQVVLQGKSRNVIIRELQRTNLDVNLAVNNLLSRDDEEYDDGDDGGPEQMIQSDDLMSLLDSGFGPNESVIIDSDFADEVFSYPLRIRSSSSALFNSGSSSAGGAGGSAGSASGNAPPTIRSARESRLRDEAFSFIERDFMSGGSGGGSGGTGSGGQKSRWYSYPVEKGGGGGCFDSLSTRQRPLKTSSTSGASSSANDQGGSSVQLAPISFADQGQAQEFWPTGDVPERKFVAIASLTSELIAITAKGELCQWRWADAEPFRGQLPDGTPYWHPRAPALGLMAPAEKVTLVAGSCIRATVATESGKLATWIDESIAPVASKLEHPATSSIFESGALGGSTSSLQSLHHHHHHHHHQLHHTQHQQQGQQHRITSLHVSSLMSVVQLSSGAIYWWGVPPFAHRKKLVEKVKNERNGGGSNSASKSASKSSSKSSSQTSSKQQQQQEEIVLGSLVCMRNSPLYQAGSIAFTTVGGLPKVGQLVNSAWKITDSCSFRVLSPAEIAARAAPSSASIGKASTTSSAASASTSNTGKTGASASSSEDLGVNKTVEMPPPPSPASSTSSEPGGYSSGSGPLPKRAKRSSNNSGGSGSGGATAAPENSSSSSSRSSSGEGANQQQGAQAIDRVEMWSLKDIVFMEDVRNLPVGRVIKVDGNYVAVKFTGGQGTSSSSSSTMLGEAIPPGSSLGTSGSSSTSSTTTTTTSAAARVSHLLTGFQQQQQQEHSLLFQAAMMGGGDQRGGGNSGGSFSPGGPRSSSSQGGGGGGGGGSSASSTDSMKTGAGGGGSQAAESFTFENFMQDCRLMRKDELTVVKPTALPTAATSTTTSAASTSAAGASASTSAPSVQGTTTSSAASPINITGGGNGSSQQGQQTQQQQQQTGAANPLGSKAANDCLQRAPKRVHLPENVQILAMTLSNLGLHCIAKIGGYRFSYILVNIVTGRVESDAKIPIEYSTFFGSAGGGGGGGKVPTSTSKIALYSAGETDSTTVVLCRDGNGTLYPLAKDCTETLIRDPIALNLGPVSTIGLGIFGLPGSTGSNSSSSSSSNSSKTHAAIVGLAFEPQLLMSAILKSDLDLVRARLEMLEAAPAVFGPMVGELCDGNHNILHIAVSACFPTSNKTGGGGGGGGGNGSSTSSTSSASTTSASSGAGASAAGAVSSATTAAERLISNMFESDEILNLQVMSLDQAENSSNSSSSNKDKDTSASTEQQQQSTPMDTSNSQTQQTQQQNHHHQHHNSADYIAEPPLDPSEQKPIAHSILWTLLDSPALQPYLLGLLSARDFNGLTPFMFAVSGRAYSAAIQLLLIMQRVARQAAVGAMTGFDQGSSLYSVYLGDLVKRTLETMLYPRGSLPDHSPLYMLCSNDTCSFTWTGEEHINQDIFECRTCGLVGSLCCCTECARVCHRGHDCKLKRTSPTAYCDCWEKCKCKALIGGCQPARFALLKRLLEATDLSLRPNARGEHLLLFLVQTVGRQIGEQRQYRPARVISGSGGNSRLVSSGRRMAPNSGDDEPGGGGGGGSSSVPDHDLEPPKFARRALETLLGDWATVKSMILTGYRAPPETFKTDVSKTSSSGANSGGENAGTGSGGGKRRRSSSSNASTSTSNLNTSSSSTSHHHLQLFNSGSFFSGTAPAYALEEENAYLGRQNGSALLDKFTHSLLRIGLEMIERLIGTLLAACSNQLPEAKVAARRFVRSVARVGLVVAFELNPTAYASLVPMMNSGGGGLTSASIAGIAPKESSSSSSSSSSNNSIGAASFGTMMEQALSGSRSANGFPSYLFSKRGKGSSSSSLSSLGGGGGSSASASAAAADTALAILGKCRRIFVSFLPIAIEELCEVAESLVVPVKRGLARPSGAFVLAPSSSEVLAATEELFNVDASVLAAHQQRDFLDSAFGLGEGAMELGVPPPPPVVLPAPVPPPTTSSLVMMVPPPPQVHPQPVIVPPPPQPPAAASTSSASNFSGAFPASSQEPGPSGLQQQQHQQPLPPRVVVDASVINEEAMDTDNAPGGGGEGGGGRRSPSAQELLEEIGAGMEEASSEAAASSSMDGSEAAGPSSRRHQMNALLEDMLADEDSNAGGGGNNRGGAGGNGGNQDHPHHHQLHHHHHHHHLHPGNVPGGADSDSDSSSSNPDDAASYLSTADNASMAQRSVVTGATAGSDVGVSSLPYDDESVNSPGEEVDDDDEDEDDEGEGAEDDEQQMRNHHHHHQGGEDDRDEDDREEGEEDDRDEDDDEDEDDEDGGSDASDTVETENEGDEIQFIDDGGGGPLEAPRFLGISTGGRGGGGSARSNILHHVQWALRQRGGGSGTGSADGTANAVSSISASLDPSSAASFRRAVAANQQANALVSTTGENVVSMANSAVGLARAFSIVIRQIGDLMPVLRAGPGELAASGVLYLAFTSLEAMALQNSVEERLKGTWEWLIGSLDSTETQLRFGCALSNRRLTSASISPISVGGGGVSASAAASISHAVAFSNSSAAANSGAAAAVSAAGAGGSSGGVGAASVGGSSSSLRRLRAFQAASAAANGGSSAGGSGASGAAAAPASADADLLFLPALSRSSHSSSLRRMSMASGGGNQNTSSLATRPISPGTSGGIRVASSGGGGGTSAAAASSAVAAANTLSATDSNSSRRDFLNYAMSLMRAHSNEHYDSLPVLDVASLKHLAYVFDAFIYYMRRGLPADPNQTANVPPTGDYQQHPDQPLFDLAMVGHSSPSPLNNAALAPLLDLALICPPTPVPPKTEQDILEGEEPEQRPVVNTSGRKSRFFRRSASTLYLGCPPPDPFSAPFYEALPLASKPHLLTPSARREQLFGVPRPSSAREAERLLEALPAQMSLTRRTVNGGSSSSSSIFADGGQIASSAPAATPIPKASTSTSSNIIQSGGSPSGGKPSVIVLAGSAKHPKLGGGASSTSLTSSSSNDPQMTSTETDSKSTGYMSVIAKAGQYNAAHADVKSLMANHYYGSLERHDALLGRWRLSLELFGRLFVDDVGLEPGSIMPELSGFPVKETKFRREMERLRNPTGGGSQGSGGHGHHGHHSHHHGGHHSSSGTSSSGSIRDLFLKVDRDRALLLAQTFKELNAVFASHTRRLPSNSTPSASSLAITRVKVTFREEPGEGSGVVRGFYTAFSEAVLANEKLPALDWLLPGGPGTGSGGGGSSTATSTTASSSAAARSSSTGYGTGSGSPSSSAFASNHFNLIRATNMAINVGLSSPSSSLAQAVSNALQAESGGGGGRGGSGSPGGSSSAPPSAAASGSSTPSGGAEELLRRPRSPSRPRYAGGLSSSRRSHIERIRHELRNSALEDFRRSSRSSPYGSSAGQSPPASSSSSSASMGIPVVLPSQQPVQHVPIIQPIPSASSASSSSSMMLSLGSGSRHRSSSGTGSNGGPVLRYDSPAFVPTAAAPNAAALLRPAASSPMSRETETRNALGSRIYSRVFPLQPSAAGKITGMLLDLPSHDLLPIITSEEEFRAQVEAAMEIINAAEGARSSSAAVSGTPPPPSSSSAAAGAANPSASSSASTPSSPPEFEAGFIDALLSAGLSQQAPPPQPPPASVAPAPSMLRLSDFDGLVVSGGGRDPRESSGSGSGSSSSQPVSFPDHHHLENHVLLFPPSSSSAAAATSSPSATSASSTSTAFPPLPPPPVISTQLPAEDNAPLFYQPGPRGFYSPRLGRGTEARLNAFRNVGRIIGICFVQNELCPITLNRHVIKYILGRPIGWHDLAFFDPDLYESLRQLILDAESPGREEVFAQLDFRFSIDLSREEGGGEVELLPGGRHLRVTPANVLNYVQRYAMQRMLYSAAAAIMALKAGVFDVLPARSFEGLTAEDFRLLLNGVNEINVSLLQSYVTFHDESGDGAEHLSYFRRWFWWVLERMTNEEKQDLVYFWTGSPALPASEEGFQPMPSITIRPRDDMYFVTANTCISRLYIPLYTTRSILRTKLLTSIKAKSFGFI